MIHTVFVYGTLKLGRNNNGILGPEKIFLGTAKTVMCYKMYHAGFPVVMLPKDVTKGYCVTGEVYLIDDEILKSLDSLEANGIMYERQKVQISYIDIQKNADVPHPHAYNIAWMYIGLHSYWSEERLSRLREVELDEDMCYRY